MFWCFISAKGGPTVRRTSSLSAASLIAALLVGSLEAQPPETAVDVVGAFHDALAAGDSSRALALLHPQVLIYESGGVEASRDEYRSHHLGADMAFAGATTRQVTKQSTGKTGDLAWVLSESSTAGTFRDRDVNSRGTETMLLQRTPAGWLITHIHWSSRRVREGA